MKKSKMVDGMTIVSDMTGYEKSLIAKRNEQLELAESRKKGYGSSIKYGKNDVDPHSPEMRDPFYRNINGTVRKKKNRISEII